MSQIVVFMFEALRGQLSSVQCFVFVWMGRQTSFLLSIYVALPRKIALAHIWCDRTKMEPEQVTHHLCSSNKTGCCALKLLLCNKNKMCTDTSLHGFGYRLGYLMRSTWVNMKWCSVPLRTKPRYRPWLLPLPAWLWSTPKRPGWLRPVDLK